MAKIEKSLEGPTLGSCHGTSKLKIKNPFYQIQVHVLKYLHAKNEKIHEETKKWLGETF
jgi:hypothetical protein